MQSCGLQALAVLWPRSLNELHTLNVSSFKDKQGKASHFQVFIVDICQLMLRKASRELANACPRDDIWYNSCK